MPVIDFTDVEEFSTVEAGVYTAQVVKAEAKKASTGTPMIALTLNIEDEPFVGRKVFNNLVLHPKALWRVKRDMIALGWDEGDLDGEIDVDPEDFLELWCRVAVGVREYEGRMVNNVTDILPYDDED